MIILKFSLKFQCRRDILFEEESKKTKIVIIVCWGLNLFREIIDEIITINPTKVLPKPEIYKN
ncbi:hypothetical protein BpHYR1_017817 [Brachionus plicatilis]|uniref:Uncharacterized protein n=1 Tax=Brachionus plicatilis TaxID=10195 RepID=A0A3M7RML4_BRAPC|nr:hypothetical protein BpHYR1_017817 [Brachionus plicatilis]